MTKIITLVKSSGATGEEFRKYWRESYLPSILAVPETRNKLVRMVHNYVLPSSMRSDEGAAPGQWAGVSEMWYYDQPSAEGFLTSAAVKDAIAAHGQTFSEVVHLHVQEIMGWERGVRDFALKVMAFFVPREGMSRADALHYWNYEHLQVTARLGMSQKLSKYIQNHSFPDHHNADPRYDFAGGLAMWFETADQAGSIFADEELVAELKLDEQKFADPRNSMMLMVEEENVYPRR